MAEPTPPITAPAPARLDGLRAFVRQAALALGLGFFAAVTFSILAEASVESLHGWLGALSISDTMRAALGMLILSVVQSLSVLLLSLVVGLAGDWPRSLGAGAGLVAALVPSVVIVAANGFAVLLPWPLVGVRAAVVVLCACAGALGILLGRRLVRRK